MTRSSRFYTCSGTSGNGVYHHVVVQQQMLGQWQKSELNACSKASRVSYVLAMTDSAAIQFWQTIYKVMVVRFDAVVHGQVDDFQVLRYIVTFHEFLCIAVSRTEEQYIDGIEWKLICKH
jgi:hypothetical protein